MGKAKRTKVFTIRSQDGSLSLSMTTNSVKQAIQRFTKKFYPVLKGKWAFNVYDHSSMVDVIAIFSFDAVRFKDVNVAIKKMTWTAPKHIKQNTKTIEMASQKPAMRQLQLFTKL